MGIFTILHWIATNLQANSRNAYNSFARNEHYELEVPLGYDARTPSLRGARSATKQSSKIQKNSAFTLAEIMIVLSVIGIITAILLPAARQATPDENVIKFKKGHNTLYSVIRELVTSDKYYLDGDLGTRANGNQIDSNQAGDRTYFCNSVADLLNVKSVNCSETVNVHGTTLVRATNMIDGNNRLPPEEITANVLNSAKTRFDNCCTQNNSSYVEEIVTTDGIVYWQTATHNTFGVRNGVDRVFAAPNATPTYKDTNGFDIAYKIFCMDVDGINKGEAAFGYGIRADGKILNGKRADEWLKKSIQGND